MQNNIPVASKLLNWYDLNARDLPWRIAPSKSSKGMKAWKLGQVWAIIVGLAT